MRKNIVEQLSAQLWALAKGELPKDKELDLLLAINAMQAKPAQWKICQGMAMAYALALRKSNMEGDVALGMHPLHEYLEQSLKDSLDMLASLDRQVASQRKKYNDSEK